MPFVANFPFFCILITVVGGVISSVLNGKNAYRLNLIITGTCFLMSVSLLIFLINNPQQITFMMGHFPAPWGNEIRFGPFEAIMATTMSLVMLLTSLSQQQNVFKFVQPAKLNLFYLMLNLMLSSTFALIYTNDIFTGYVFIEINTLCACGLVMAKENGKTIAATVKYLIMSLLGSGLFLVSIILLYDLTGHLLMVDIHNSIVELMKNNQLELPLTIVLGLLSVGVAIKSALFPFHTWVPNAYNRAMNISNALSSGLVMKGYIILLIKIMYRVIGLDVIRDLKISNILFLFGFLAMIVGSLDALREDNIKRMLGYSSIAQIGYIYLGLGLGTKEGILAAGFIIIAHSLTKSMLFSASEGLQGVSDNTKYIKHLKGSAYRNPIAALAFAVGGFSMLGFPLLSGFSGKFLLAIAGLSSPHKMWFVLSALAISTLLNAIYFIKVIAVIYTKDEENCLKVKNPINYSFALSVFVVVNIALGLCYSQIVNVLTSGINFL